jgi:hypothetical protein
MEMKVRGPGRLLLAVLVCSSLPATSFAAGPVQAELRTAASLVPAGFAPSAPAGGATVGTQPYICDAADGVAPLIAMDASLDPVLEVGSAGLHLPILGNFAPASCGQIAYDGNANLYIAQGVLASNTAAAAAGILRQGVDPATGALTGSAAVIAANSGLGGNQPTALAIGPDGNLYFGNLKNGDIKRIINPGTGTTQVVQSVGRTPNGRPMRSMAFWGADLYLGSSDSLSVITGATNPLCTGGCNAAVISDGFSGVPHVGMAADGTSVFFAVSGSANQVWRYTPTTLQFALVASGGADAAGGNASSFSFVDAKTNQLDLDASGNLWIGDDTSKGAAFNAGRVWMISSAILATTAGGQRRVDPIIIADLVNATWDALVGSTITATTINADGTFTITLQPPGGAITTDAGTWTLTPPLVPKALGNPQAHLTLVDAAGTMLLDGDILLINRDQFAMMPAHTTIINIPSIAVVDFARAVP